MFFFWCHLYISLLICGKRPISKPAEFCCNIQHTKNNCIIKSGQGSFNILWWKITPTNLLNEIKLWVECLLIPAAPGRVCGAPGQRCQWPDPRGSAGHLVCLSSGPPAAGWADPPSRRLSAALPASPGTSRWCARSRRLKDHSWVIHTQTCLQTQAYMSRHTFSITIGLLFNVQWKCNVWQHMFYRSSCIMQN